MGFIFTFGGSKCVSGVGGKDGESMKYRERQSNAEKGIL